MDSLINQKNNKLFKVIYEAFLMLIVSIILFFVSQYIIGYFTNTT